jgi:hypothetical protein
MTHETMTVMSRWWYCGSVFDLMYFLCMHVLGVQVGSYVWVFP